MAKAKAKVKGWIDATKRVPADDALVLVAYTYIGGHFVTIAEWSETGGWSSDVDGINFKDPERKVSHWMPIPIHPDYA